MNDPQIQGSFASRAPGRLVVVSGPSGAGKTSVCRALREDPRVEWSVSATTRTIRSGEIDGVDYHFLSDEEFASRRARGEFLEWAKYNSAFYGTLRAPMVKALAHGRLFLLEIEVQGTRQLRDKAVPGIYVFIVPPSMEELRRRLIVRSANSIQDIDRRLEIARCELESRELYDHVIVNDELQHTIAEVRSVVGLA